MKILNVKGCNDYLPKEQRIRNYINDKLKETFIEFGYQSIETSILCYYDMLIDKYDEENDLVKEIYKLSDQKNRDLGLRYDLTVPFAKFIALNKNKINLPFKRYEISRVFRDGPVKLGRAREFYQCDVDACGVESPSAEVEYFNMTKRVFKEFNIDVEIRFNNRKFLSGILEYSGVSKENIPSFIISVDKLDKMTREEVEKELINHTDKIVIDKVFNYFNYSFDELKKELENTNIDLLKQGLDELDKLINLINAVGLNDICIFTPFLARGLEIYTGSVWEIFDKSKNFKSALGSGGRYDKIITNFLNNGNEYPAIGMSFGLEPIYELLRQKETEKIIKYDVYVYAFNIDKNLFEISELLRNNNLKVLTELNNIKLKKAMNIANRENIKYVVIIGEDELKCNSVSLKNMISGEQEIVKIDELVSKIN